MAYSDYYTESQRKMIMVRVEGTVVQKVVQKMMSCFQIQPRDRCGV